MPGQIKEMIDLIIQQRAKGNQAIEYAVRTKLILKGIDPKKYGAASADDAEVLGKLQSLARELEARATMPSKKSSYVPGAVGGVLPSQSGTGIRVANSNKNSVDEAVADIKSQLGGLRPRVVVYFSSLKYMPIEISMKMHAAFPDSAVFGCSSSGELFNGKVATQSVGVMALSPQIIGDARVEVIRDIGDMNQVNKAFASFGDYFKCAPQDMPPDEYVGIVLVDGLGKAEENLMDRIGDLTNITFAGGSAGDDFKFARTFVYGNGKTYPHAAVLAILKPLVKFDFIKTQSVRSTGKKFIVTKADEPKRIILELDRRPALEVYAQALGTTVENVPPMFFAHPLGLKIGDEFFVRSIDPRLPGNGGLCTACAVAKDMELHLLETSDIIEETRKTVEKAKQKLGGISALINFQCIYRQMELQQKGLFEQYETLFTGFPSMGFGTYGEQYLAHLNQTSVMLVFK